MTEQDRSAPLSVEQEIRTALEQSGLSENLEYDGTHHDTEGTKP